MRRRGVAEIAEASSGLRPLSNQRRCRHVEIKLDEKIIGVYEKIYLDSHRIATMIHHISNDCPS